jgi:homoserine kinase
VIALGLVAGAAAAGLEPTVDELLAAGLSLEGHADNLAAALAGGVCATADGHVVRLADDAPAQAVAVVPESRVRTDAARASLPAQVAHEDAAATAGHALLLGAALATGSRDLFAAAAHDRLHEPYRAANAPRFDALRSDPPAGAVAVTLSGSGPTVIVWSDDPDATAEELRERFPDDQILPLSTTPRGAGPL